MVYADEQADYEYRETCGPANVIWMSGLLDAYEADKLAEVDLMRELWAERPDLMASLYNYHGEFNTCFKVDLITAQSNGVKVEQNGEKTFYDATMYRNANGVVLAGYEKTHNNAVRANKILQDAYGKDCACRMNNKCCYVTTQSDTACKPSTGQRCCNTGANVWDCSQNQGNPCSP